jgi:hypothetical protein
VPSNPKAGASSGGSFSAAVRWAVRALVNAVGALLLLALLAVAALIFLALGGLHSYQ